MTYKLSFRIRKIYCDQIVAGTKKEEFRKASHFWLVRANGVREACLRGEIPQAVFVCGKGIHRRAMDWPHLYDSAMDALERLPTLDEFAMLGNGPVIGFRLGGEQDKDGKWTDPTGWLK